MLLQPLERLTFRAEQFSNKVKLRQGDGEKTGKMSERGARGENSAVSKKERERNKEKERERERERKKYLVC